MHEALRIFLSILILPCKCLLLCCRPGRRCGTLSPRERVEHRQNHAPRPLPSLRKRALTLPLPPPRLLHRTRQRTRDQVQASLSNELSLYVRRLLYEEIFGGGSCMLRGYTRGWGIFGVGRKGSGTHHNMNAGDMGQRMQCILGLQRETL